MNFGTEIFINHQTTQAQIISSGLDLFVGSEKINNSIIGIPGPIGSPGVVGSAGLKGDPGEGVPSGGALGQVLKKQSGIDFDTTWQNESSNGIIKADSYTVAALPSATLMGEGSMIYVSDEKDGATLAFSDGADWRRVGDREIVAAASANLVFNGGFDIDVAGWVTTNQAALEWEAGRMKLTTTNSWNGFSQDVSVIIGQNYLVSFDYEKGTASDYAFTASPDVPIRFLGASGMHSEVFTATTTTTKFFVRTGNSIGTLWIDNASVSKV